MITTEQPRPESLTTILAVDADHPAFAGHFEEFPIIAGVYQLDWVVDALARHHGCAVAITAIPRAKFTAMIRPGVRLQLTVSPKRVAGGWCAKWQLVEEGMATKPQKFSEGRVEYSL